MLVNEINEAIEPMQCRRFLAKGIDETIDPTT
jgi:hypothetical protein